MIREHSVTAQEKQRRADQRIRSKARGELEDHRVLSFLEWCFLNSISPATGRRLIKAGEGPMLTRLSPRRIGITVAANAAWQAARSTDPP
jgi:hypothetical protein